MPFLAMVAGVGLAWVTRQATSLVRPLRLRRALPAALATCCAYRRWPKPSARILTAWATTIFWPAGLPEVPPWA